jgi:hypothetical protein
VDVSDVASGKCGADIVRNRYQADPLKVLRRSAGTMKDKKWASHPLPKLWWRRMSLMDENAVFCPESARTN